MKHLITEYLSLDCVVLDGTVVTASDTGRYDIGIKDGKIALLAPARSLAKAPVKRIIDAEGAYVTVLLASRSRSPFFPLTHDVDSLEE